MPRRRVALSRSGCWSMHCDASYSSLMQFGPKSRRTSARERAAQVGHASTPAPLSTQRA
jgi:hypothetical protein